MDGHFPEVWGAYLVPGIKCNIYTNGHESDYGPPQSEISITVESVTLANKQSPGGFTLVPGGEPCSPYRHLPVPANTRVVDGCAGVVLPPLRQEPVGCLIGVRALGPTGKDYTGTLTFSYSATCSSRSLYPCSLLPQGSAPSEAAPITVRWSAARSIAACFTITSEARGGGSYSEEEKKGRCPPPGTFPTNSAGPSDSATTGSSPATS